MVVYSPLGSLEDDVYQTLIYLDESDARILIDVGWNALLDAPLDKLIAEVDCLDLILLTHATVSHLGAYCYLCKLVHGFAKIPVYATLPVVNMGKAMTLDMYRSKGYVGPFQKPFLTAEEIETYFENIKTLKYSQPVSLRSHHNRKLETITITAYNSGHTIGGTMWKIMEDIKSILVSLDWNHGRDSHLNGAFLEMGGKINEQLVKPDVMITTSNISNGTPAKRNRADLFDNVEKIVKGGGTVVMPTSSGTRVLELCLLLDKVFTDKKMSTPIVFASQVGQKTLSFASSILEWMLSSIIDNWQVKNDSPFDIDRMRFVTSLEQLSKLANTPKVILVPDECLELGFSRRVFTEIAADPNSAIILTQTCPPKTLGNVIYKLWEGSKGPELGMHQINQILPSVTVREEVPLQGSELAAYNQELEAQRKEDELQQARDKRNQEILETLQEDEFSSDDDDDQILSDQMELGILVYGEGVYDIDLAKLEPNKVRMFPYIPQTKKSDDYGGILKPGQFEKATGNLGQGSDQGPGGIEKFGEAQDGLLDEAQLGQSRTWKEESKEAAEPPQKIVHRDIEVSVLCSINYLDFNGLTDLRSMKMIIPQVQPGQLIVLPGSDLVLESLKEMNIRFSVGSRLVRLVQLGHSIRVTLTHALEETLNWQHVLGGFSVAHVAGKLEFADPLDKEIETQNGDADDEDNKLNLLRKRPRLAYLEVTPSSTALSNHSIFVGDIRLTQLRKKLVEQGFTAEFKRQGVLVCNDNVVVKRATEGQFVIEGKVDFEFYAVRESIKSFLAVV